MKTSNENRFDLNCVSVMIVLCEKKIELLKMTRAGNAFKNVFELNLRKHSDSKRFIEHF